MSVNTPQGKPTPQIWVDADACPKPIKEMLSRAAQRCEMLLIFVANQGLAVVPSPFIKTVQVEGGFDVADKYIAERVQTGDLVITADIPLAADVIAKGAKVLGPRGETLNTDNIKARLTMRNFMEEMRSSGQMTGGPPPFNNQDKQAFGNALDRWLAKQRSR